MRLRRLNNCGAILAGYPFRPISNIVSFALKQSEEFSAYQEGTISIISPSVSHGLPRRAYLPRNNILDYSYDIEEEIATMKADMVKDKNEAETFQNYRPYISQRISPENAITETNFLWCRQIGNRVKLQWNRNDDADFFKYVLLWDKGTGDLPTEVLAEIQDPDEVTYITNQLSNGTYRFLLVFEDICGNQGVSGGIDYGKTVEVAIAPPPASPAASLTFNPITRKATIYADTSDIVVVHSNHLICKGLLPSPHYLYKYPITPSIGDDFYDTLVLFAGTWRFNVFAANKYGVYSDPVGLTLQLIEKDGALIEVTPIEETPILEAEKLSLSRIKLTWYPETPPDCMTEIYASSDAINYTLESLESGSNYLYSGEDETTYWFKVRFMNSQGDDPVIDCYSDWSNIASETADGTPPAGDQSLMVKLV